MSSNRSARMELERLFGKICMIEELGIRNIPKQKRRKIKGYTKYDDVLTYHHIFEKQHGGKTTLENGALVRGYNHRWLHSLPPHQKEQINRALQEYKIAILSGIQSIDETGKVDINFDFSQIEKFIDSLPETFTGEPKKKKPKFNRAKQKRELQREIDEALYGKEEEEDDDMPIAEDRDYKKEIIDQIVPAIQEVGKQVQSSGTSQDEQLAKVDVLLDTIRFLDNYDENVQVLNRYWREKHWKEKFSKVKEGKDRDD